MSISFPSPRERFYFSTSFIFRCFIASFVIFLILSPFAIGQYHEDAVNEDLASSKNEAIASGNQEQIQKFLKNYYFARWTQKENLGQIHLLREELKTDVSSHSGAEQTNFLNAVMEELTNMVKRDDIWPASRYNAALALGMFNDPNDSQKPYAPAISVLLSLFSTDAKLPDYITLAVLLNLDRYSALGIADEENRSKITNVFLETLETSFGKKRNYTQEAVTWMQMKAIEGLTALGTPSGTDSGTTVIDTFTRLLTDDSVDSSVKNMAVRGIGAMNFSGNNNNDFSSTVISLARYAEKMTQKELDFINEEEIRQIANNSSDLTSGNNNRTSSHASANSNLNELNILNNAVPRILYDLNSLESGIVGSSESGGILANLTKEEQLPLKNTLESILEEIEKSKNFFEYGPDALNNDFNPKPKKGKQGKNAQVYFNKLEDVKDRLENQKRAYQGIIETASQMSISGSK